MRKPLVAVAALAIVALPAAPAAAASPRPAYFKVSFKAVQNLSWTENLTYNSTSCGGSPLEMTGHGSSSIRIATPRPQPAVATREPGRRSATLLFGGGGASVPVQGTYRREGSRQGQYLVPPPPGSCPKPEPTPIDCGTKRYPAKTRLYAAWESVGNANSDDLTAPLFDAVVISGPEAPGWTVSPGYLNCPEVVGDHRFGAPRANAPAETGRGSLPLRTLFGRRSHFRVEVHLVRKSDITPKIPGVTGSRKATTDLAWTMQFTRLARRPPGL